MEETNLTLDQIIEQSFDFSEYSEEEKNKVIAETSGMIMEASLLQALGESDEAIQEKFGKFIESEPDEAAMTEFISEHFPNFGDIVLNEIKVFREIGDQAGTEESQKTE